MRNREKESDFLMCVRVCMMQYWPFTCIPILVPKITCYQNTFIHTNTHCVPPLSEYFLLNSLAHFTSPPLYLCISRIRTLSRSAVYKNIFSGDIRHIEYFVCSHRQAPKYNFWWVCFMFD